MSALGFVALVWFGWLLWIMLEREGSPLERATRGNPPGTGSARTRKRRERRVWAAYRRALAVRP